MPPLRRSELPEFTDRANEALRIAPESHFEDFLEAVGVGNLRVRREGGRLVAGAGWIPTDQRVGGAWVPSALVTAVWVEPAARGRGAATALMAEILEELRAAGTPLSTLYPATLRVYRGVGYEIAGAGHDVTAALRDLPSRAPEGWTVEALRDVTPENPGLLAEVYAEAVPALGALATRRVRALWNGALRGSTSAYVARAPDGGARGTAILDAPPGATLHVREVVALEPDAARTLLAFIAGYRGMTEKVIWIGGPFDAFATLLDEWPEIIETDPAMVRLIDVPAALRARGYPRGLSAEVAFDVVDPTLPANAGRLTLTLDGSGAGEARPGGDGCVRADVRGLAALYTGYAAPRELAVAGLMSGPPEDLDALAAAFAGARPWLTDRF